VLLALPAASVARAHKSTCHVTATNHSKHVAHKCSRPARKAKPTTRSKRHRSAHARPKLKSHTPAAPGAKEAAGAPEAFCSDGSTPLATEEGTFSCEDGTAPTCEAGLVETLSSDGATLLCEEPTGEEPES